jgi:hypothetical protein
MVKELILCLAALYLCALMPFRHFPGHLRRELMQSLSMSLYGTLGSYICYVLQESNADAIACVHAPKA